MNDPKHRRTIWFLAAAALGVALLAAINAGAAGAETSRYPYDPACAWGRIADGRGMLLRCLTEQESTALAQTTPATADAGAATAADAAAQAAPPEPLSISVGPVVVDTGQLPQAEKKLGQPKDRYAQCVNKNGGLRAADAEVDVRFLVQAPRGRAEGVEVVKVRGMAMEAARCIADVIDRRSVGTPEAPMVAATITIKVRKQSK